MSEDSPQDQPAQAFVRRQFYDPQSAILAHGNFRVLFESYLEYIRLWEPMPDGLGQVMMRQALGAACLHLACRPPDESVAWTLNIKAAATNLFVSGDGGGGVVGRLFTRDVKLEESSRLFVESHRAGGAKFQSTIEVVGLDVLGIFEQYYTLSVQTNVRFIELAEDEFVMVLGLPMSDKDWIASLKRDDVIELLNGPLKLLDQKAFEFKCHCNKKTLVGTIAALFSGKMNEFFCGEESVEASCPRCARIYTITSSDFE